MRLVILLALFSIIEALAQPCLAVDGDWITARDIAERVPRFRGADPEMKLVRAPFPGAHRLLNPSSLPGLERTAGEQAEAFCVERRMRAYSREEFQEAIRRSLVGTGDKETNFELVDYARTALPSGRLEFLIPGLPPMMQAHADDPVLWRGKLFYTEGRSVPVWMRVRLWREEEVCVLTRDVPRGGDLGESDCQIARSKYPPFAPAPLRDATVLERTSAARRLVAHEPIYQTLLVHKPDVEIGKPVELRVINGGTRLKFEAKAASSARTGESVFVTNPANGKRLEGQVVGKNTVEVHLK